MSQSDAPRYCDGLDGPGHRNAMNESELARACGTFDSWKFVGVTDFVTPTRVAARSNCLIRVGAIIVDNYRIDRLPAGDRSGNTLQQTL